jgi:Sigma-70 factor, region 1.2
MRSDQEHLDLFRMYVDQIGQHPLLTKQDEIEPSQAYQAGLDALRKLADCAADDLAQAVTSLETPVGEDGAVLGDFLEDDSAVGPDELVVEAVGREALEQALRALPERERQVLILRFGLDSGTPDAGGGRRGDGVLPGAGPPGRAGRPGRPAPPRGPGWPPPTSTGAA